MKFSQTIFLQTLFRKHFFANIFSQNNIFAQQILIKIFIDYFNGFEGFEGVYTSIYLYITFIILVLTFEGLCTVFTFEGVFILYLL